MQVISYDKVCFPALELLFCIQIYFLKYGLSLKRKIKALVIFKDSKSVITTHTMTGVVSEKQACFHIIINSAMIIL